MPKVSRKHLGPEILEQYVNCLWSSFALMPTKADIRLLFNDLVTRTEKEMLAKRLAIARCLLNKDGYDDIQRKLKVTAGTVAAVSSVLAEKGGGFRMAHNKLGAQEQKFLDAEVEKNKNLSNPFRVKLSRKTLFGTALKVGLKHIDKKIIAKIKQKSAKDHLKL